MRPARLLAGNHMLLRVLPSVYPRRPEPIHRRLHGLAALVPTLANPEQQHLVRLIQAVAQDHPLVSICVAPETRSGAHIICSVLV